MEFHTHPKLPPPFDNKGDHIWLPYLGYKSSNLYLHFFFYILAVNTERKSLNNEWHKAPTNESQLTHTGRQTKNPIRIAAVGWFVSQIFRFYANSKKKNRMEFTHTMNTYISIHRNMGMYVCVLFIKPVLKKYYSTCVNVFICQTQNQNLSTFHTKKKY